jgi:hypothetical protein
VGLADHEYEGFGAAIPPWQGIENPRLSSFPAGRFSREQSDDLQVLYAIRAGLLAADLHRSRRECPSEMFAMRTLILLSILVAPGVVGAITVGRIDGPAGFVLALAVSLYLMREATQICMILMRRWQVFGRDLFLIEQGGRHRWVDVFELKSMREPCKVRAQQFRPDFRLLRTRRRD